MKTFGKRPSESPFSRRATAIMICDVGEDSESHHEVSGIRFLTQDIRKQDMVQTGAAGGTYRYGALNVRVS